jgi:hypothetical protein
MVAVQDARVVLQFTRFAHYAHLIRILGMDWWFPTQFADTEITQPPRQSVSHLSGRMLACSRYRRAVVGTRADE